VLGVLLFWLWQPARQVRRHSDNFLHALEKKDWASFAGFVAEDYHDQWRNDRAQLLKRTHEMFRYVRTVRFIAVGSEADVSGTAGRWRSRIQVEGDAGELTTLIKDRVNCLSTPFELEWRRGSARPWDWKLVQVTNPELSIPESGD
jgi:hypothetical protein